LTKKSNITWLSDSPIITPVGTAQYGYLQKPDQFGNYSITYVFDDNPETTEFVTKMTELSNGFLKSHGIDPVDRWKSIKQRADKFDGRMFINFKTPLNRRDGKQNVPINTFNSKNEACDEPWSGDRIRVAFSLGGWHSSNLGTGAKAYIKSVQLVEKARGDGGAASHSPFGEMTGGYEGTSSSTEASEAITTPDIPQVPSISKEDLPF
tara:strand:- start:1020 stop:1643 length:624 start_codon:yes stop_codon:yes gene_type:complete